MSKILAYALMAFVAYGLLSGTYEWFTGERKTSPPPKVETAAEKPTPKVKRPEQSMLTASYNAIAAKTGMLVTDSWLFEFSEYVAANGTIHTNGFVELNGDEVKRQFWLTFDPTGKEVLRLKIDSDLIYSVDGK